MKLHENSISFEEIQKIVTNKKIKKGDLETFELHQEGKILLSFKNEVKINTNLSKEIKEHGNVHVMLSPNSTIFGGSNLKILATSNCSIEVGNNCRIWTDDNCTIICGNNCEINCDNNCKITTRKTKDVIVGDNCEINYNGHGSDFEKDIQNWTIGENNRFQVGALEYFVKKRQL